MKKSGTAMILALILMLTGCGGQAQQEAETQKRLYVVLKAMDSIHWMSVKDGLEQGAREEGISVSILWPDNENDADTQQDILQDMIASHPDALAVAPCDSHEAQQYMQEAKQNGVQTVYIDEEAMTQDEIPYIGSNNYYAGEMAAQALAGQLPAGSTVAVISGNAKQSAHINRIAGFRDYIEEQTDFTLTEIKQVPDSSTTGGQRQMAELLEQHPEVDGVFCTSAMIVMGAMQQRDAVGRGDVQLVGMDTQSDALTAVQDGKILAMVGQNGHEIGYQTIRVIAAALRGESIDMIYYVDNSLITQDNVASYLEEYLTEGRTS